MRNITEKPYSFSFAARTILVAAALCAIAPCNAGNSALLYDISPTAGGSPDSGFAGNWGFDFTITSATTFKSIGLWDEGGDGLLGPHTVGIFNSTGGAALASATVDNSSAAFVSTSANGRWLFTDITPITLQPGTYTLGFFNPTGGTDVFRGGATGVFNGGASFSAGKARAGATSFAWPDANSASGGGWYGPNLSTVNLGAPPPPTVATGNLPGAAIAESYGTTLTATGGTGTGYQWNVNGPLPPGMDWNISTGVISGTPSATGTFNFSVQVTDSGDATSAAVPLSIVVTSPVSFAVVNDTVINFQQPANGGLYAISPDGQTLVPVNPIQATDLAIDPTAGAFATAGMALTTSFLGGGSSTTNFPSGSTWVAVAYDAAGNYIVGDGQAHAIWRISPDGLVQTRVGTYTVASPGQTENIRIAVDGNGNYVVAEDNGAGNNPVTVFVMTPAGVVTPVALSGSPLPLGLGGLVLDASGNYMLLDSASQSLFKITPAGATTVFDTLVGQHGLARNPLTNEYLAGVPNKINKITGADSAVTTFASTPGPAPNALPDPRGIVAFPGDSVSAVAATNPLGYFRMETAAGVSESRANTYALSAAGAAITPNGAIASNNDNYVLLDGTTGQVTTNLSGGINTAGSMMAWVFLAAKPSTTPGIVRYIAGESQTGNDFDLQFTDDDTLRFYTTNNGVSLGYAPSGATLAGQWHMAAATFDNAAGKRAIYWDGLQVATDATTSFTNKTGQFAIGNSAVFTNRNFIGGVDDVAVWNYALSAAQVSRLFAASAPPGAAGYLGAVAPNVISASASSVNFTLGGVAFPQGAQVAVTSPSGVTTIVAPASASATSIQVTVPAGVLTGGLWQFAVIRQNGIPSNRIPVRVNFPALGITPNISSLPEAAVGQLYAQTLTATGGSGTFTWSIPSQSPGLNFTIAPVTATTASLTGTPTASNTSTGLTVTVTLTDTVSGLTAQQAYSLLVAPGGSAPVVSQASGTIVYILSESGVITSVAGGAPSPLANYGACAGACSDIARDNSGNFIVATGNSIARIAAGGASGGPIATTSGGANYDSVAIDGAGNFIVGDGVLHKVHRISADGTTQISFDYPVVNSGATEGIYVRVDSAGNYIIAENNSPQGSPTLKIYSMTPAGVVTPIALTGSTPLSTGGLTFDANGNYVDVDTLNHIIYTITPAGAVTPLYVDQGFLGNAAGITRDAGTGKYFLVDSQANALFTFDANGANFGQILAGGPLALPIAVAVSSSLPSLTYVLESGNTIAPVSNGLPALTCPIGICPNGASDFALDGANNFIVAAGQNLARITTAGVASSIATAPNGGWLSVAVDATGNYIVAENVNHQLVKVTPAGAITPIVAYPVNSQGVREDVYVRIDSAGHYIVAEDNGGLHIFNIPPGATSAAALNLSGTLPDTTVLSGLAFDSNGNYILSNAANATLYSITPAGVASVYLTTPGITAPLGLYRNPSDGSLLFVDNHKIDTVANSVTGQGLQAGATTFANSISVITLPVAAITVTTTSLPPGRPGQPYGPVTLTATGGSSSYHWIAGENLAGLTLSGAGVLTGVIPANATGTLTISVRATDANLSLASPTTNLSLAIIGNEPPPPPALSVTSSPSTVQTAVGGSVAVTFSAFGGTSPYRFTATGMPPGVALSGSSLSGSPTAAGTFTVSVTASDSGGKTAFSSATINVLGLTTSSLPAGVAGQFYTATLSSTGSSGAASFSATGVPPGLGLNSSGTLNGTPKTAGNYTLSVTVSSGGQTTTGTATVTIAAPQPLSITSTTLATGTVDTPYSQSLTAKGGLPPYVWSGTLPAGLSLSTAGVVSGSVSVAGTYSLDVAVADAAGANVTGTVSLAIQTVPLKITRQSPLPAGMAGVDYPQQVLEAKGGVAPYSWSGTAPNGMTLSSGGSLAGTPSVASASTLNLTVTDSLGAKATGALGLTIRPIAADLILTSGPLNFSLLNPAGAAPAPQSVGVQATVASQQLSYSLSVSPVAWLAVAHGASTPDVLQVSLTSAALTMAAGDYTAVITVTCTTAPCSGKAQSVSVGLNVATAPPRLSVTTGLLAYATTTTNLSPITQALNVKNSGAGQLGFNSIACEASWCSVGPFPNTLGGGASAAIPITVDPNQLHAGFFRTQVDVDTSGGKSSVPVTIFIASDATMTLAPSGSQFNMPVGSAPGNPAGSFLISVVDSKPVTWNASVLPGASWLALGSATGSASPTQPGTVSFSIDPAAAGALAAGAYYGQIRVTSEQLANSPQDFEVVLNVSTAATALAPDVQPGGLLFLTSVGGVVPPQTVNVYSGAITPAGFQTSASTTDGANWLSVTPATGTAGAGAPGVTSVSISTNGLKAGVYQGGVNYSLSATAVRTVNVTLIVANGTPAGASSVSSLNSLKPRAICAPTKLAPTQTGLVSNFSAPASWPTPLAIVLVDDCGSTINGGQVVATFSNGDPPLLLSLADPGKGLYSGTWSPRKSTAQMSISVHASAPGYLEATTQIAGAVTPNTAPSITPNGTLHTFDPLVGDALAPGTIIQIYGENLATLTVQPADIPLPKSLNNTSVLIGGLEAPLFYVSSGQINAQIPFELQPGKQYQVIVSANGALTTPSPISLSPATPGIAVFTDSTMIAQHSDGTLVSKTAPAIPREYLVSYLAGLGDTTANLASGAASPVSPLATPTDVPVLTINGSQYPTSFVGMTPGLVGLYQMNFQVPAGLAAGNLTVSIAQNGQSSNQATLPYQP